MVYSLGFFSILFFGMILSNAGSIASAVFDDALVRWNLRLLTRPAISCIIWGSFYYIWMALIAVATLDYKVNQVGNTGFTLGDGYWFTYISSTTIGLGDIILDPEVFLYGDLVLFALLFLAGFVLLAAFITRFVELIHHLHGNRTLVEDMLNQLKTTDMMNDRAAHAVEHVATGTHKIIADVKEMGCSTMEHVTDVADHARSKVVASCKSLNFGESKAGSILLNSSPAPPSTSADDLHSIHNSTS
jgi:Ion channel